jgi:NAD(P)-dependent dehydrogenase (short-subunit alcohol dehydrogenase family)
MPRYENRTAVITGGSTGIGLATARKLVEEGARVLLTGRDPDALRTSQEMLGGSTVAVASDAASLGDIDELAERAHSELGELDLLFVNAGITRWIPFSEVEAADYDTLFDINTKGAYFTVQKLAPLIKTGGAIVLTTSVVNVMGYPLTSVYAATKAALRSMTRSFARELLDRDIRVNAVSPGVIDTDVLVKAASQQASDTVKRQLAETNPMKRIGRPEEIATAVLFLAFEATYTTGAELAVDGGATQL